MQKLWMKIQLLFREYATCKLFRFWDYAKNIICDSQGIDVYNDRYIFQGNDYNATKCTLSVIDIIDKKVNVIDLSEHIRGSHMNNINIGSKFYSKDKYPLLYISECRNRRRCHVIHLSNGLYIAKIIQTIEFNSKNHYNECRNAFDWFISGEYIYTFGMSSSNEMEIIKFPMPNINNSYVKYTDKHIINSFKIQDCNTYQGSKVINGKLYALFGLDTKECPTYLKVVNLTTGIVEKNINIKGLSELEGLGQYKDGIIVSNCAINPTYTYIILK